MRESKIEKEVCKYAREKGWLTFKWSSPGNRGVPDRILIKKEKIIFIEFKPLGGLCTELQLHTMGKLIFRGFSVFMVDNVEYGKKIIDKYDKV